MKMLEKGMKIRKELVLLDEIVYYVDSCSYYDDGCRKIYKFIDDEDNIYVWKTSKSLGMEFYNEEGTEIFEFVNVGDKLFLAGTVKENKEFRGENQIVLTRCSVKGIICHNYISEEEIVQIRRDLQLAKFDDYEIKTMKYKEYKENYSQYETLIGSFIRTDNGCFIDVIIS